MDQKPEIHVIDTGRIQPRIADQMDARTLRTLVPRLHRSDEQQIRGLFRQYLAAPRTPAATSWQQAWNAWTGAATAGRAGVIEYTPNRCHGCEGRRFTHLHVGHNLSRTGSPIICGDCTGTGRGQPIRVEARYARSEESPA